MTRKHQHDYTPWWPDGWGWSRQCLRCLWRQWRERLPHHIAAREAPHE